MCALLHTHWSSHSKENIDNLTVEPSGGSGGYAYIWSDSSTSNNLIPTQNGTYCVTVTDVQNGATVVNLQVVQKIEHIRMDCGSGDLNFISNYQDTMLYKWVRWFLLRWHYCFKSGNIL